VGALPLNGGQLAFSGFAPVSAPPIGAPGSIQVDLDANPLGRRDTRLLDRSEIMLFTRSFDASAPPSDLRTLDDEGANEAVLPGLTSADSFGQNVRAAAAGNFDGDGEDEALVAVAEPGRLVVHQVDRQSGGGFAWSLRHSTSTSHNMRDIALIPGDFDGDGRDEHAVIMCTDVQTIAAPHQTYLWVYDDPVDGGVLIGSRHFSGDDGYGAHIGYRGQAGDIDGDGLDELVLVRRGQGLDPALFLTGSTVRVSVFEWSEGSGQVVARVLNQYLTGALFNFPANDNPVKVVTAQLDSGDAEEIVVTWPYALSGGMGVRMRVLKYDGATQSVSVAESSDFAAVLNGDPDFDSAYDICAVDRTGGGRDELALFRKVAGAQSQVDVLRWSGSQSGWTGERVFDDVGTYSVDTLTVRAADTDADGGEEIIASYCWGSSNSKAVWVYAIEPGATPTNRRIANYASATQGATVPLIVVPLDLDADGLQLRYTGEARYRISNPVPLTLMAAVPTKEEISQNTAFSGTSYFAASGAGVETALTTSTTITAAFGAEYEDITGLFGASVKATVASEMSETESVSSRTTFVTGYTGAYDSDVIVFAAHLYLTHEYEVVSAPDPATVGALITIDQPLDTNVYKWTVPFYNQSVPAKYHIGTDLIAHDVGDPSSYRTRAAMAQHTQGYVRWSTPNAATVGQGGGFNTVAIDLESENATTTQERIDLGGETSFKAWGVAVEGSFAIGEGSAYTVATHTSTVYEGVVGDIADPGDYGAWSYNWGMEVYHPWRLADLFNEPTGFWGPGGYPLVVIDFWVEPTGSAY